MQLTPIPKSPLDLALILKDYLSRNSQFTIKGLADFWGISEKTLIDWLDIRYHLSEDVLRKIASFIQNHYNQMAIGERRLSVLRLRYYLKSRGITQAEVAKRLGTTHQNVSSWINERMLVPDEYFGKINSLFAYEPPDNRKLSLLEDIMKSDMTDEHKSLLSSVIKALQNA